MDFDKISVIYQAWHNKELARLFHASTRVFHTIPFRRGDVPVRIITVKWMCEFLWKFPDMSAMI